MLNDNTKKENKQIFIAAKLFGQYMNLMIAGEVAEEMEEVGLTDVQFHCLRFIYCHPEPSGVELAEGLSISNAAATKMVDRLVKKGLLERKEHPGDRRLIRILLTQRCQELMQKLLQLEKERFNHIIQKMDAKQQQIFYEGLTTFLEVGLESKETIDKICLYCGQQHVDNCPGNILYDKLANGQSKRV